MSFGPMKFPGGGEELRPLPRGMFLKRRGESALITGAVSRVRSNSARGILLSLMSKHTLFLSLA